MGLPLNYNPVRYKNILIYFARFVQIFNNFSHIKYSIKWWNFTNTNFNYLLYILTQFEINESLFNNIWHIVHNNFNYLIDILKFILKQIEAFQWKFSNTYLNYSIDILKNVPNRLYKYSHELQQFQSYFNQFKKHSTNTSHTDQLF